MASARKLVVGLTYLALGALSVLFAAPFVWMVGTSLKVDRAVFAYPPEWIPRKPIQVRYAGKMRDVYTARQEGRTIRVAWLQETAAGVRVAIIQPGAEARKEIVVPGKSLRQQKRIYLRWGNYPRALKAFPFFVYLRNSLIICIPVVLGTLISCTLAAYGFSRLTWPGRDVVFFCVLSTLMIPYMVTLLPMFLMFRAFGWIGTFLPLTVPAFFGNAFDIFLLRQFFRTLPAELSDAARIDGCGELTILWRIVAPLSKPALATVGLMTFIWAWLDFMGPLVYLNDESTYTLALGLSAFLGRHGADWSGLMAAATVVILPVIVLFFFAQRTFIKGIALTGMKG
jgi:multiple sugar transport system permease protein